MTAHILGHIFDCEPNEVMLTCTLCGLRATPEEIATYDIKRFCDYQKCECGGSKVGYPRGNVGHSHWCSWR